MNGFGHNSGSILLGNQGFIISESERLTHALRDDMELHFQNASKAGANMVEFAIRSLSTMAFRNPSVQVPGLVPYLGTSLDLNWKFFMSLCSCIVFGQILLSVFTYLSYVEHSKRDTAGSAGI